MSYWHLAIGILAGFLLVWLGLVGTLYVLARREPDAVTPVSYTHLTLPTKA